MTALRATEPLPLSPELLDIARAMASNPEIFKAAMCERKNEYIFERDPWPIIAAWSIDLYRELHRQAREPRP